MTAGGTTSARCGRNGNWQNGEFFIRVGFKIMSRLPMNVLIFGGLYRFGPMT
jgi:hypothetical protein